MDSICLNVGILKQGPRFIGVVVAGLGLIRRARDNVDRDVDKYVQHN